MKIKFDKNEYKKGMLLNINQSFNKTPVDVLNIEIPNILLDGGQINKINLPKTHQIHIDNSNLSEIQYRNLFAILFNNYGEKYTLKTTEQFSNTEIIFHKPKDIKLIERIFIIYQAEKLTKY
jgi:hypothetical protein